MEVLTEEEVLQRRLLSYYYTKGTRNVLCSVRATPSNIPKWASCGLYKKSGLSEMRLMG